MIIETEILVYYSIYSNYLLVGISFIIQCRCCNFVFTTQIFFPSYTTYAIFRVTTLTANKRKSAK